MQTPRMRATERSEGGSGRSSKSSTRRSTSRDISADDLSNERSPSTTFAWKYVKVGRPPEASTQPARKGRRFRLLPPRNPRDPLKITVKLRGGAEQWIEVHARGDLARYPGYTQLIDVVLDVNAQRGR